MKTTTKTLLSLTLALASAACSDHLTRDNAKSQLEAVVKTEQMGLSPRLAIQIGTVFGNCSGLTPNYEPVQFDPHYAVLSATGYVTARPIKKYVWEVALTQLGQQAIDRPKYAHEQQADCDEWQVDFPLSKYNHLDVTGIVEDGLHAKADASLIFVITPVGIAIRKVASSVVLDTLSRKNKAQVEEVLEKTGQQYRLSASRREQMRSEMLARDEKSTQESLSDEVKTVLGYDDDLFYAPADAKSYTKKRTFLFEKYDDGWRVSSRSKP